MPTPRAGDGTKGGPNQRGSSGDLMLPSAVVAIEAGGVLPTPTSDAWTERMKAEHNNGNGHGPSLNIEAQRLDLLPTPRALDATGVRGRTENRSDKANHRAGRTLTDETTAMLPTPSVADGTGGHETRSGERSGERLLPGVAKYDLLPTIRTQNNENRQSEGYGGEEGNFYGLIRNPSRWGKYAAAIEQWEKLTRPAPEPTNVTAGYLKARAKRLAREDRRPVGRRGSLKVRRQLAARFSEWMMGVPPGWITDVPGITRNEALKAAGNGVVPQQAAEALRFLLDMPTGREIAAAHEPDDLLELLAQDGAA